MKITTKNLLQYFPKLNKRQAYHIMKLCNGTRDPLESLEMLEPASVAANKRLSQCYNRPTDTDLILHAINALIDGYGVEGVPYYENAMYNGDFINFVNRGDTYTVTVLFNPDSNQFEISDWGSIYEKSPEYARIYNEENEGTEA